MKVGFFSEWFTKSPRKGLITYINSLCDLVIGPFLETICPTGSYEKLVTIKTLDGAAVADRPTPVAPTPVALALEPSPADLLSSYTQIVLYFFLGYIIVTKIMYL